MFSRSARMLQTPSFSLLRRTIDQTRVEVSTAAACWRRVQNPRLLPPSAPNETLVEDQKARKSRNRSSLRNEGNIPQRQRLHSRARKVSKSAELQLSSSSNSKKMEQHKTPHAFRSNLDSRSDCQSGSLGNSSLNSKVGQSSFTSPSPSPRSRSPQSVESHLMQTSHKKAIGASSERGPGSEPEEGPFDICRPATPVRVKLRKSILVLNREKKKELERVNNTPALQYLRSGMVLLKNFIGHMDQVNIVNKCRDLSIGSGGITSLGGFYRPGYSDGAKLHLHMMCLGKDWSPETRSYNQSRSLDGAVPPEIPEEFRKLVDEALNASHKFLRENAKNVEEIPNISPDICIVNFYNDSGRLGLHQDRDESEESLKKGLPVVSFSIGDSAEFLYSDARDVDKAKKVTLESGDVLIFGGKSRHIFHGVSSIKPKTAPEILTEETNLRPGRLNLTFRQY